MNESIDRERARNRDDLFGPRKVDLLFQHLETWFFMSVVALVFVIAMAILSGLVHWWQKISQGSYS